MAGALGLMDCSFVASINRTPIATSSSSSSSNANGRPQKFCTLRSSFNSRSMDSSFWNGGGVYNSFLFITLISLCNFLPSLFLTIISSTSIDICMGSNLPPGSQLHISWAFHLNAKHTV